MNICGLQKTTLLDYPGHVAAAVFTGGCNFRCPFCHNSEILSVNIKPKLSAGEVLSFLDKRKDVLQGVCITGGEPTLQPDLEAFIRIIRGLGLKVKLDTNGYETQILKRLVDSGLVDYVAMDVKSGWSGYGKASGVMDIDVKRIGESISFLMQGTVTYEFRTTVVKGIHTRLDFVELADWICGCRAYYLQNFVDTGRTLTNQCESFSQKDLEDFVEILRKKIPQVKLRGL